MNKTLHITPRMSEKAYAISESLNTFIFDVPAEANKQTVAELVEKQYKVKVVNVRIANLKGKAKRTYRKRSRALTVQRRDIAKAYVTLAQGDKLPFFAEVNEQVEAAKPKKEDK